jgi:branched-chain amino acid transport system substrate-binding protein
VEEGRLVAQEVARDPAVMAVVGHLHSHVTVPAAAVYDLAGLVLVAPTTTTPELTARGYPRVFRTVFSDAEVGRQMAAWALRRGYRRVAIYYARSEYGRALANAFEEYAARNGGEVVSRESYDPGMAANPRDAEQTVTGWGSVEFDAVFLAGQDQQAALLASELRRRGIAAPLLGSDALATPTFLETGGAAVEGAVIASAFHPGDPSPRARAFTAAFRRRWGRDPDVGAALGYDAVRVLAEGMRHAGTPAPDSVAAALHRLRGFEGVTGTFAFDSAGNLSGSAVGRVVVRGGRFHFLPDTP